MVGREEDVTEMLPFVEDREDHCAEGQLLPSEYKKGYEYSYKEVCDSMH